MHTWVCLLRTSHDHPGGRLFPACLHWNFCLIQSFSSRAAGRISLLFSWLCLALFEPEGVRSVAELECDLLRAKIFFCLPCGSACVRAATDIGHQRRPCRREEA